MRIRRIISISLAAVIICIIYQAGAFFIKGKNPMAITDGQQAAENRDGLTASTDVSPAGGEGTPYTGGINPNPGAHNTSPGENSSHSGGNGPGSAGDHIPMEQPAVWRKTCFGDIPGRDIAVLAMVRIPMAAIRTCPGGKTGGEGRKREAALTGSLTYRNLKTEIGIRAGYKHIGD